MLLVALQSLLRTKLKPPVFQENYLSAMEYDDIISVVVVEDKDL